MQLSKIISKLIQGLAILACAAPAAALAHSAAEPTSDSEVLSPPEPAPEPPPPPPRPRRPLPRQVERRTVSDEPTPLSVGALFAAGATVRTEGLNFPIHLVWVMSQESQRVGLVVGFSLAN